MPVRRRPLRAAAWPALVLAGLLCAGAPTLVRAQGEPVLLDRIVAIVDEEMILQSDLDRAIELYQIDRQYQGLDPEPVTPELRQEVLDSLIESKLIIAAAKAADLRVEEEDIESQVEERIQQLIQQFGSREALEAEMRRSGMTMSDFRLRYTSQLRDQQYLRLVVGRFIRPDIEVLENEVEEYYLEHLDEMPAEPDSVTISNILIRVQPDREARQAVQRQVAEAQQALRSGSSFADVARRFSQGPNASRGGRIGTVKQGDLFDEALERAVFGLQVGEISQPVVSSRGVHLLRLDEVRPDGGRTISQIFFPLEVTQADVAAARERIEVARQRVLDGEPFSLVAQEISEDPTSAPRGGVLGTFQLDQLSAQFQEALRDVQPGQVSEPLLTDAGWYVFLVTDRVQGHLYTYEELQGDLRRYVENQKIETALADYIDDLRERFFVDIKN